MKKALNAFAMILTLFAVLGLASPVFACGGDKSKKSTTASTEKQDKDSNKQKAESNEESKEEKSETPTKS